MKDPQIRVIVSDELKKKVDEEANRLNLSSSGFMRLLIHQYFQNIEFGKKDNNEANQERSGD